VIEAVRNGETVYVAEGEKDVHAIEAAGGVATCNPMGAGKWRPEYGDVLKGATVIVVADKDPAGFAHAAAVRADLTGKAASVTVVEAAEGKDAANHLADTIITLSRGRGATSGACPQSPARWALLPTGNDHDEPQGNLRHARPQGNLAACARHRT
jgi:DNA primase